MDYAEAVMRFEDEVSSAIFRAGENGLTPKEVATELKRMAKELEDE